MVICTSCFVYVNLCHSLCVFFFKQKTAYEMRISDWSSDVCSSDLTPRPLIGCWDSAGGGRVDDPQHVVSADVAGRAGGVVGAHASQRLALQIGRAHV